jgi:hypothetical protein
MIGIPITNRESGPVAAPAVASMSVVDRAGEVAGSGVAVLVADRAPVTPDYGDDRGQGHG